MKKVFLVDDEIEVREGIRQCIDWTQEGFIYSGDAPDGEIALPMIEQIKPDILITDIRMPFMDGLQLSRIVRTQLPSTKIIILSGHDEFEYARDALRINIAEYCLKPLSSADLLVVLHETVAQIEQEELAHQKIIHLENQALKHLSISRENLLNGLCKGTWMAADAIEQANQLGIEVISKFYQVLIVEHEADDASLFNWICDQYPCLTYNMNIKETAYIFRGDDDARLEQQAAAIKQKLIGTGTNLCSFGFGETKDRLLGIAHSYAEAMEEKSFQSIVHHYRRSMSPASTDTLLQVKKERYFDRSELVHFLKYGAQEDILIFSQNYAKHLKFTDVHASFYTYYFIMDLTMTIANFMDELDGTDEHIVSDMMQMENRISWLKTYEEITSHIQDMLHLVIEVRDRSQSKFSIVIQKAKDYVDEHYDQDISLQVVASYVNVSPSYFSHIFSQETNQTFIEYLTMIRINRAMELLKTTNDKVYEISEQVGYSDPHYFCHLFKKVTGMTTTKFKSQKQVLS